MTSALASPTGIAARGRFLVAVALVASSVPMLAVGAWSRACADRLGNRVAAWLVALTPTLPAPPDPEESGDFVEAAFSTDATHSTRTAAADSKHSRPARPRPAPKSGIRISSAQVLALASRRAMPRAVFVKASPEHPPGLLLGGVSALGVGLQDGDILTEAAGQKATSVAQVVGIVLAARSRQASEISGRFYRGGVPFSLTVEQPYPENDPNRPGRP
ncbi:MAG TPA: hypothetical protein VER96_01885 [Polyangiaceae bacterium]|nr:hypothetical protein [Polyangiaceae bacterium]